MKGNTNPKRQLNQVDRETKRGVKIARKGP